MRSIINRRGSKAATRALKRLGRPSYAARTKTETPQPTVPTCSTCANIGWDTMDKVAACNCCENGEFYTPVKPQESNLEQGA